MNTATQEDLRSPEEIQNEEIKKEFVEFLHSDARHYRIPATCDRIWLASVWQNFKVRYICEFFWKTGKTVYVHDNGEFFEQAAESYEG